jgi:hypothetical protein
MGIDVVVELAALGVVDDAAAGLELMVLRTAVAVFEPVDISPLGTPLDMPPSDELNIPPVIMPEPLDILGEDGMLAICELEDPMLDED